MSQYIKTILEKYKKIVVWGTGNFYAVYKDLLDERFVYFVDNDAKKQGTVLDTKNIFPPKKLKEENADETLVVICNHYFEEISIQITQYGDLDLLDILTLALVRQKEEELLRVEWPEAHSSIVICGGIHAMWQTNGSRRFIDGQLDQLHHAGFHTIEMIPLPYYRAGKRESTFLAVSVNGVYQGLFPVEALTGICLKVRGMIIHSLYYSQSTMKTLLDSIRVEKRVLYYVHDYSCLCYHRFLYRDQKLCIGTDGAMVCGGCSVNGERQKLLDFYQSVFKKYNVLLVVLSSDTRRRVEPFYRDIEITKLPHLEYEQEFFEKQVNGRIRIAYIGTAIWQKGWEQFAGLVDRFHGEYEFYCLGDCPEELRIRNVRYIRVGLKGSGIPTMTEALR